jgi:hypothetical protein
MLVLKETILRYPSLKYNIEFSNEGHELVSLVISFLAVARVSNALSAYFSMRDDLNIVYHEARELVQNMVVLSSSEVGQSAKEWRHEVAYRTLLLLRTVMAVVDYPDSKVAAWDIPELSGAESEDIRNNTFMSTPARRWAHQKKDVLEESMRVPVRVSFLLRKSVYSRKDTIPVDSLMENISAFMRGYNGMRKFLTMVCYPENNMWTAAWPGKRSQSRPFIPRSQSLFLSFRWSAHLFSFTYSRRRLSCSTMIVVRLPYVSQSFFLLMVLLD